MKEDSKLSKNDLDYIVNELKEAQKETAATFALQQARPAQPLQKLKSWLIGSIIGAIAIIAVLFAAYNYWQNEATLKSAAVVESVQQLATLATAQAHIKTIISEEDNKLFGKSISFDFPGSKRTLFLVVPGEVTAGVDLKNLTDKDIRLDAETKTINLTLPPATIIQSPSIDLKNIQTFSSEGLFRSEVNWDEGFELQDLAKQHIEEEAIQSDLLKTAEENARIALEDFFGHLDYRVSVSFE